MSRSTFRVLSSESRTLEKEIPQLQEIASKVWKREEKLKSLKAELAALDRKIQLELAPQVEKKSKEENKEATNNVKADVTSKGLRIKDPCQQVRIY
ncbi:hypothetical protein RJT11_09260 [Segatella copri]|uniref:hypothetical protein n=1 Tax=Segatella copri TaxID=165179 RepID=UPI00294B2703|nr:hypothetical protein [Segatella copri]WOG02428.1 hypothetical protein RJT11_09260 [Segatella copri]